MQIVKIDTESLKTSLKILCKDSTNLKEILQLVKLSRIIVCSYLNNIKSSLLYLCELQGITTNDLAYDCIAEIFSKDDSEGFYRLEKFCNSLNDSIEDTSSTDIFLAYKSYLSKVINAQLAKLYSQSDPAGAKILRNIRDAIKKSDYLSIEKTMFGNMIVPKKVDPLLHLPPYPINEFEKEYFSIAFSIKDNFNEQLVTVNDIIIEQSEYRRALLLLDVVNLFKNRFYSEYTSHKGPIESDHSGENLGNLEIEEAEDKVLISLREKIFLKYFTKGKLNKAQAEAVYFALRDIINDWCLNGGCSEAFYSYLRRYIKIDESAYNLKYKAKIEYLTKLAREEFIALMDFEL